MIITEAWNSVVSSKGRVVIPKALRERLQLRPGSRLKFHEEADGLRLEVIAPQNRPSTITEGMGLADYAGARISDQAIRSSTRIKRR